MVTTHLGVLKDLAAEEPSIVNASLQFDTGAMRPTFRLVRDRPGRSYALEIARRLGSDEQLAASTRTWPGLRVPGTWDGFEIAVRAILGQQVTVKGATTRPATPVTRFPSTRIR